MFSCIRHAWRMCRMQQYSAFCTFKTPTVTNPACMRRTPQSYVQMSSIRRVSPWNRNLIVGCRFKACAERQRPSSGGADQRRASACSCNFGRECSLCAWCSRVSSDPAITSACRAGAIHARCLHAVAAPRRGQALASYLDIACIDMPARRDHPDW